MKSKIKILTADDEPFILDLLSELLEHFGFEVIEAEDGAAAWRKFQDNPDLTLVITDYVMPKLSGMELIKKIKTVNPDFPVILITAYSHIRHEVENKSIEYSPDGYLEKPFDLMSLINKIKEILPDIDI